MCTAALFDVDASNFIYPDLMIRVRADEDKIRNHYLLTVLQSGPVREFVTRNAVGAAGSMPKINQSIVERIPIPLPPLPTQQAIVAEIEAEQALVAANRELIARFEQKIQATLARVWGEAAPAVAMPRRPLTRHHSRIFTMRRSSSIVETTPASRSNAMNTAKELIQNLVQSQPEDDRLLIIAVMHLHRQPGYWQNRT